MDESADQYRAARAKHANALRALGLDPFGTTFAPTHSVRDARALAQPMQGTEPPPRSAPVRLAGRIGNLRSSGKKLLFATLFDRSRAEIFAEQRLGGCADLDAPEAKKDRGIQLFCEIGALGERAWTVVESLDLADWVGVEGTIGRSKRGEISCFVTALTPLGKAMLPPPHQAGADAGTLAPETRARQRYLDLLMSDGALATFLLRSRLVAAIRGFFTARGYLEVETPILQPIPGGAPARPFVTHHNSLGTDFYLRIAPELYLKRLLVGGMERVFEVGRNFRNEGISLRHNPEFTLVEWYEAFADYRRMMDLSEELFRHLADSVLGTRVLRFGDHAIDLGRPWRRLTYNQALRELGGLDYADQAAVRAKAKDIGINEAEHSTYDRLANAVWEAVVEPHLIEPTFITNQPTWLTPLCRADPQDPTRTLRTSLLHVPASSW